MGVEEILVVEKLETSFIFSSFSLLTSSINESNISLLNILVINS